MNSKDFQDILEFCDWVVQPVNFSSFEISSATSMMFSYVLSG